MTTQAQAAAAAAALAAAAAVGAYNPQAGLFMMLPPWHGAQPGPQQPLPPPPPNPAQGELVYRRKSMNQVKSYLRWLQPEGRHIPPYTSEAKLFKCNPCLLAFLHLMRWHKHNAYTGVKSLSRACSAWLCKFNFLIIGLLECVSPRLRWSTLSAVKA